LQKPTEKVMMKRGEDPGQMVSAAQFVGTLLNHLQKKLKTNVISHEPGIINNCELLSNN
ncbi:hypothetical protein IRJ41_024060, partial [Triplophysa rosa]